MQLAPRTPALPKLFFPFLPGELKIFRPSDEGLWHDTAEVNLVEAEPPGEKLRAERLDTRLPRNPVCHRLRGGAARSEQEFAKARRYPNIGQPALRPLTAFHEQRSSSGRSFEVAEEPCIVSSRETLPPLGDKTKERDIARK